MSDEIHPQSAPRKTTTTYVAQRRTIRIAVPDGWARGALAGAEAAFVGWALCLVAAFGAYMSVASNVWMKDFTPKDALGVGGDLWAAVLGGTSVVGGVPYRAAPTLMGVLVVCLLRLLLRSSFSYSRASLWLSVPAFAFTSWILTALSAPHAQLASIAPGALGLPFAASAWATVASLKVRAPQFHAARWLGGGVRTGVAWAGYLAAAGSVLAVVALVAGWGRIAGIHELLGASSAVDNALIVASQAFFAPTAAAWALAWWAGPGFFVGADAVHSPSVVGEGPIPPFPLLGAVPTSAPGAWTALVLIAVGAACGARLVRRYPCKTLGEQMGLALTASLVFDAVCATWMWSATMSAGAARMSALGPNVGWTLLALTLEVPLVALVVTVCTHPSTRERASALLSGARGGPRGGARGGTGPDWAGAGGNGSDTAAAGATGAGGAGDGEPAAGRNRAGGADAWATASGGAGDGTADDSGTGTDETGATDSDADQAGREHPAAGHGGHPAAARPADGERRGGQPADPPGNGDGEPPAPDDGAGVRGAPQDGHRGSVGPND